MVQTAPIFGRPAPDWDHRDHHSSKPDFIMYYSPMVEIVLKVACHQLNNPLEEISTISK